MRDAVTSFRLRQQRREYTILFRLPVRARSVPLSFTQRERQYHHSDLVFFQDSLLLKRELLKTATLNVPGPPRIWEEWGTLFFLPGLSVVSFYSIFRPALGEASSGSFYHGSTRPVSLSLCRFPGPSRNPRISHFDRHDRRK